MSLTLDHIRIAIPPGAEGEARAFWCDTVGLAEIAKPEALARRGGLWLSLGRQELHLGTEPDFRPAKKAHPGFLTGDIDPLAHRLEIAGHGVVWDTAQPDRRRFFTEDPFGNRLEFLQLTSQ